MESEHTANASKSMCSHNAIHSRRWRCIGRFLRHRNIYPIQTQATNCHCQKCLRSVHVMRECEVDKPYCMGQIRRELSARMNSMFSIFITKWLNEFLWLVSLIWLRMTPFEMIYFAFIWIITTMGDLELKWRFPLNHFPVDILIGQTATAMHSGIWCTFSFKSSFKFALECLQLVIFLCERTIMAFIGSTLRWIQSINSYAIAFTITKRWSCPIRIWLFSIENCLWRLAIST